MVAPRMVVNKGDVRIASFKVDESVAKNISSFIDGRAYVLPSFTHEQGPATCHWTKDLEYVRSASLLVLLRLGTYCT